MIGQKHRSFRPGTLQPVALVFKPMQYCTKRNNSIVSIVTQQVPLL